MNTKVLLAIDDKTENLFLIRELMEVHLPECEVISTQDPEAGLQIAAKGRVDVILADVQMPRVDGIELCQRMKSNPASAHIPLVLITAHKSEPELKVRGFEAGADDFISKPIAGVELVARVKAMLRIKEAEDRLRDANDQMAQRVVASEENFRLALQDSAITVFHQDKDLRYTWIYNAPTGIELQAHLGRTAEEIGHISEDAKALVALQRRVLETGEQQRCRVRTRINTAIRHFDVNLAPLRDAAGAVVGVVGTGTDVTEAQRALAERETTVELLRLFNQKNDTRSLIGSVTGVLQRWSGCEAVGARLQEGDDFPYLEPVGFSEAFITSENSLCKRGLDGLLVRDELGNPIVECMCGHILCGRTDARYPFFTPHGSFWSNCTSELAGTMDKFEEQDRIRNACIREGYESVALIPLRHAGDTLGLLQFNDHAKNRFTPELLSFLEGCADQIAVALSQRMVDAKLRENENRLSSFLDNSATIAWMKDEELRYVYFSKNFGHRFDMKLDDWRGKTDFDMWPREIAEGFRINDEKVLEGDCPIEVTEEARIPGTQPSWWLSSKFPFTDSLGHRYIGGLGVDISERKKAEDALRASNEEMARFTYAVSHDLKSPLVTIQTFLGYLREDVAVNNAVDMEKDMGYIQNAASKMSSLLDELLELSRIGRQNNLPTESLFADIVSEALALVAGRSALSGADIQVTQGPLALYGDRQRLVALFQNLLDNAIKFMGEQPDPKIEAGFIRGEQDTVFFVRDNGQGIEPRHHSRLFQLFEKLDPGSGGTGMGLALVKRIVETHGGRIWVESEGSGHGTTFHFTLGTAVRWRAEEVG